MVFWAASKKKGPAGRGRDITLYTALMMPHLEYCVKAYGHQNKKNVDLLE